VQSAQTVLGPIQEVSTFADIVTADPSQEQQNQQQTKQDKEAEKSDDDDGSASAALGLVNTGPVQLKNDLEQPVTSGGMDTTIDIPGSPD
jgi:hypothetical protein